MRCFGHETSNKNKELVEKKQVWLEKDVENKDKYDRLLRNVYLPVGGTNLLLINDFLVREGYAQVYTFPPNVKYVDCLILAQQEG